MCEVGMYTSPCGKGTHENAQLTMSMCDVRNENLHTGCEVYGYFAVAAACRRADLILKAHVTFFLFRTFVLFKGQQQLKSLEAITISFSPSESVRSLTSGQSLRRDSRRIALFFFVTHALTL